VRKRKTVGVSTKFVSGAADEWCVADERVAAEERVAADEQGASDEHFCFLF